MFGKLLKYDFRSMLKQFAFIWPAALALAVINRFTLSGLESTSATGETVAAVAMMVFVAIMIAMFVITLIFVRFSMFRARAAISSEPTQVISAMTASPSRGERKEASREMLPWYKNNAAAEKATPMPREEAKTMELMPSSRDLAWRVS